MNTLQDGVVSCCTPCDDSYMNWRSIFSSLKLDLSSGALAGLDCFFVSKNVTTLCGHVTDL